VTTAEDWLAQTKAVFSSGEFFRAFDLAQAGLREHPGDLKLGRQAVLCLANSGALELAIEQFDALGLANTHSVDILSLRGRLATDRAFRLEGVQRTASFRAAKEFYQAAYRLARAQGSTEAYYPAINGAYLALLAGNENEAALRGDEILAELGDRVEHALTADAPDRYWILATAMEAHLLTGNLHGASKLAPAALEASKGDPSNLASTWRQLRRILAIKKLPASVLAALAPAHALHYAGHMISPPGKPGRFPAEDEARVAAEIERVLDGLRIGAAYGALAAGADIMFAEALLRRGVQLQVILPFRHDEFVELSVRQAGESWVARFEACMARATSVRYATEDSHLGDDHLFAYSSQIAMGLAVLYARHLQTEPLQIVVWDGVPSGAIAGTAVDTDAWHRAGLPRIIIECGDPARAQGRPPQSTGAPAPAGAGGRRSRAMLFGDVSGFSGLTDAQLPSFTTHVMGAFGRVIARFGNDAQMVNTWGDGLFLVFEDAGRAASCALELSVAMSALDLVSLGLPEHLSLRLGGHFGPIYELIDPILQRVNFYGAHVSRAARIEPIVPRNCVYVTETFAAVLALSHAETFACDYVGWTEMAKKYGSLRMFLLRPKDGRQGPSVATDIERAPLPR
jgi:class 3 adenylate cyclase